eukprot:TRINITY_DN51910_c0_g1_i2.p1 TRINITY_DN51910_c0_g1~~TRINITY_DN51910_c0_g1_i2.p1  ORF type:complete len:244 (+),score=23.91 TRINITY_DN51910_c0_g1_i2:37-768(+)
MTFSWIGSLDVSDCNIGCSARTLDAAASYLTHEGVYAAFGIHPLYASDYSDDLEAKLTILLGQRKAVAVGECGLDFYDKESKGTLQDECVRQLQESVFVRQMKLAVRLGMPLVVHSRNAASETLTLMREHLPPSQKVHVHCFTGPPDFGQALLDAFPNLYLGFTGNVTFKTAASIHQSAIETPLSRILLETDGPYMAPVPYRGRIAHPGHVVEVARRVASLKNVAFEEVLQQCRDNTRTMYGF